MKRLCRRKIYGYLGTGIHVVGKAAKCYKRYQFNKRSLVVARVKELLLYFGSSLTFVFGYGFSQLYKRT